MLYAYFLLAVVKRVFTKTRVENKSAGLKTQDFVLCFVFKDRNLSESRPEAL